MAAKFKGRAKKEVSKVRNANGMPSIIISPKHNCKEVFSVYVTGWAMLKAVMLMLANLCMFG